MSRLVTVCAFPDLKVMLPVPFCFREIVHVPSPLSVASANSGSVTVAVMLPVAPFGLAITVILVVSLTLPVRWDGVAVRAVMAFPDCLMVPSVSS